LPSRRRITDTLHDIPVYTLIVEGTPFSYTAGKAPSIGEVIRLDAGAAIVRVLRSLDGGRIYVGEAARENRP
jgi:hypothetical protein